MVVGPKCDASLSFLWDQPASSGGAAGGGGEPGRCVLTGSHFLGKWGYVRD